MPTLRRRRPRPRQIRRTRRSIDQLSSPNEINGKCAPSSIGAGNLTLTACLQSLGPKSSVTEIGRIAPSLPEAVIRIVIDLALVAFNLEAVESPSTTDIPTERALR